MILTVRGKELRLNKKDMKLARMAGSKYLKEIKAYADREKRPSFYYSLVLALYILTRDILGEVDLDMVQILFDATSAADDEADNS